MGLNQGINHKHWISTKQDLFLCSCGAQFPIASQSDEDIQGASRLAYAHVDSQNGCQFLDCPTPFEPHIHSINGWRRLEPEPKEQVVHPNHYGGDTVYETIKVLAAWQLGFLLGNAVKYLSRAGKKDPAKLLEDLRKGRWYLDEAIKRVERGEPLF
jgi:hypothetical protein